MKLLILIAFLLAGCNNDDNEVSSGGSWIDPAIVPAYELVADIYNFSGIRQIYFTDSDEYWMAYMYGGFIKVSKTHFSQYTDRENACALVHELAHYHDANQTEAFDWQHECLRII